MTTPHVSTGSPDANLGRKPFVSGPGSELREIAPEQQALDTPGSDRDVLTPPVSDRDDSERPSRPELGSLQRSWNWFSYSQSNASSALTRKALEPVTAPRAVIVEPGPDFRNPRGRTSLIPFSNNVKRLSGHELNRKASMLMLLYPAAVSDV